MLVTAGLGWITAVAVGLTGTSAGPVVDALPSVARQVEPPGPAFGRTLDLDAAADRATRSAPPAPSTSASPTSAAPSTSVRTSLPAPERSGTPAPDAVRTVRQGDGCRTPGATAVTKSGAAAVCTRSPGKGELRWRRV